MSTPVTTAASAAEQDSAQGEEPDPQRCGPVGAGARAIGPGILLSPEQVVRRALSLAAVGKDGLIDVAGPDGLSAMISLCRAGFERVEFARQATCGGADEAGDLLLIVGPMRPDELALTIARTVRLLRDDGTLIVQLRDARAEAAVKPALAAAGFTPTFTLVDRSAGRLVLHRVRRAAERARKIA